jgi:hypothetical protein
VAHDLRGNRDEVSTVAHEELRLAHDSKIRLMNQRGGLQRVSVTLAAEVVRRKPSKLSVRERHPALESPRRPSSHSSSCRMTSLDWSDTLN